MNLTSRLIHFNGKVGILYIFFFFNYLPLRYFLVAVCRSIAFGRYAFKDQNIIASLIELFKNREFLKITVSNRYLFPIRITIL